MGSLETGDFMSEKLDGEITKKQLTVDGSME